MLFPFLTLVGSLLCYYGNRPFQDPDGEGYSQDDSTNKRKRARLRRITYSSVLCKCVLVFSLLVMNFVRGILLLLLQGLESKYGLAEVV